jgi:hypothetical protein
MKTFSSMTDFAKHLLTLAVAQHEATHASLEQGAKIIEKRAKEKIGEYQGESGPFIAWPELAESTKADRLRQGYSEDEPGLRSGAMRDSITHQVSGHEAVIGSDDDKLVYFELGTSKQPPRSVLGGAAVESIDKICEITGRNAVIALVGADVFGGRMAIEE